jgi:hypothetical protein
MEQAYENYDENMKIFNIVAQGLTQKVRDHKEHLT